MSDREDIDPELKQAMQIIRQRERQLTAMQARLDRMAEEIKGTYLPQIHIIGRDGVEAAARQLGAERVFKLAAQACLYTFASLEVASVKSQVDLVLSYLDSPPQEPPETEGDDDQRGPQ